MDNVFQLESKDKIRKALISNKIKNLMSLLNCLHNDLSSLTYQDDAKKKQPLLKGDVGLLQMLFCFAKWHELQGNSLDTPDE